MARACFHHIALRVAEMDRAVRFYERLLGSPPQTRGSMPSGFAQELYETAGPIRASVCWFDLGGWGLELFAFTPARPPYAYRQTEAGIMHFALYVEDVDAVVAAAEAAGGTAIFATRSWGDRHFVYVRDPDGNVIELLDTTIDELIPHHERTGLPEPPA